MKYYRSNRTRESVSKFISSNREGSLAYSTQFISWNLELIRSKSVTTNQSCHLLLGAVHWRVERYIQYTHTAAVTEKYSHHNAKKFTAFYNNY